ncbi:MAG: hypoxanthine phosphoribosyltransferase, partial [Deltaproteobacteria bacterium CG_4_10_14_3_um_filter_60_8]
MTDQEIVYSAATIQARVRELGARLTMDYHGRPLVVIGVLNGAFIFLADLVRAMDLDLEVDFVRAASYGAATVSSGRVALTRQVELCLAGKDVLLVEDIVDTGRTLAALMEVIKSGQPNSLKVCALIDKTERREVALTADYACFTEAHGFLVGYGLDCAEQYRNLPAICRLRQPSTPPCP